jgi:acyl-CoA dehydrogenase
VREGWITADERGQLEQLRELTWDAISVDDFDTHEMEAASLHRLQQVFRAA